MGQSGIEFRVLVERRHGLFGCTARCEVGLKNERLIGGLRLHLLGISTVPTQQIEHGLAAVVAFRRGNLEEQIIRTNGAETHRTSIGVAGF